MTSKEERVRRELRRRAWDAAAAVYDALELTEPIEEVFSLDGGLEMVVTFRRAGAAPQPPGTSAAGLEPVQRYLEGCWLTDLERGVVAELLAGRNARRTTSALAESLRKRLSRPAGEGPLKAALARMADDAVMILDNDRSARPPGYAVTSEYVEFLRWVALKRPGSWAARQVA